MLLGTAWGTHRNSNLRAAARIVNCGFPGTRAWAMNGFFHSFRASPPVLSIRLQIVKPIANKPKCAGLAQEIGSSTPNSRSLPWKNVINWTWLRLSIFDWPGGLLLIVPTCTQFRLRFYWWDWAPKKKAKLRYLILLSSVTHWGAVETLLVQMQNINKPQSCNHNCPLLHVLDIRAMPTSSWTLWGLQLQDI